MRKAHHQANTLMSYVVTLSVSQPELHAAYDPGALVQLIVEKLEHFIPLYIPVVSRLRVRYLKDLNATEFCLEVNLPKLF